MATDRPTWHQVESSCFGRILRCPDHFYAATKPRPNAGHSSSASAAEYLYTPRVYTISGNTRAQVNGAH